MNQLFRRTQTALTCSALLFASITGGASAGPPTPRYDSAVTWSAPEMTDDVVIADDGATQPDGRTFYRTGKIHSDTLVVIPGADGLLPGGITRSAGGEILLSEGSDALVREIDASLGDVSIMAAWRNWSAPIGSGWAMYEHRVGFAGDDWDRKLDYSFSVTNGTTQWACTKGRGYRRGYLGGEFGVWEEWYNTGCRQGSSGQTTNTVPWGYILSLPAMRFQSQHSWAIAAGQWKFGG